MKKILNNLKNLILRHKLLSIICTLALIIIIFLMYIFFDLFIIGTNKYGSRLKGIEKVKISTNTKNDIASALEEAAEVTNARVRVQGKIIYIDITYTNETSIDKAKEIATTSLDKFDEDEKDFYDIHYLLNQDTKEETGFNIAGSKKAKRENISWIKN